MDPVISQAGQPAIANVDASEVVKPSNPDTSQGFPDVHNQPKEVLPVPGLNVERTEPVAPVEPVKPADGTETPAGEPMAPDAVERLKGMNARNAKLLAAVGLDPLGDLGERLERDEITPEMVRDHVSSKFTPSPSPTAPNQPVTVATDPVSLAEKELVDARKAYDDEYKETQGVSMESNNRVIAAMQELNDAKYNALTEQMTAKETAQQVNESLDAVANVARQIPEYEAMDQPLRNTTEQVTIALTGMIADQEARKMGLDPRNLTTSNYQYYAGKATEMLGGLATHFRALGHAEAKAQFIPTPTPPTPANPAAINNAIAPQPVVIAPANASGAPVPTVDPYRNANVANHKQLARDWAKANVPVL